MKFIIYSKPECQFCVKAKILVEAKGHEYEERVLDVGQPKEDGISYWNLGEFKHSHPTVKSLPFILKTLDGSPGGAVIIGGFSELVKFTQ